MTLPPKSRKGLSTGVLLAAVPLAAAAAWIAYSALAIEHEAELPNALSGERVEIDTVVGRVSLYRDGPESGRPLLLVHSINAAASAYEVRPLFERYRGSRPVYAIDLPGFGFSGRAERIYTPRVMADAIHAAAEAICARHAGQRIDVIALSLSCEYVARTALERPKLYRSLGLISPTGFDKLLAGWGVAQSTRGSRFRRALVAVPLWSQALYDLVTSRPSMRFFLAKTWGSPRIDEGLLAYDYRSAHQPGARHAVWSFLSGFLFAGDATRVYTLLELPVWAVHGTRGDFVDYRYLREVEGKPNWSTAVFETGAFPHFEATETLVRSYDAFQASIVERLRPT